MSGQKKKENREKLRGWKTINEKYYKSLLILSGFIYLIFEMLGCTPSFMAPSV